MSKFRAQFPFFERASEVYLDTAATSQRLNACLHATYEYFTEYNANVHRGSYTSARKATKAYEDARCTLAEFMGAQSSDEIVFTSGATAAINMLVQGLVPELLNPAGLAGKSILLCESEHHANLLPWQAFAKRHNMFLERISLGPDGTFGEAELAQALDSMTNKVAVVAIAHVSNALGNIYPIQALCEKARQMNIISLIDGTQAAAHIPINVTKLDCDFYTISGHKMYAATGIGVLYGKAKHLHKLTPSTLGGEMIKAVSWNDYTLQPPPLKFEAGTPNISGAIGLAEAARFIKHNIAEIQQHEASVYQRLLARLTPLITNNRLHFLGNKEHSISLASFYIPNIHTNDIASFLSVNNIAVRAGHHCAMPLMQKLGIEGCVRISVGCYTSFADIDVCVDALYKLFDLTSPTLAASKLEQKSTKIALSANEALSLLPLLPIEEALIKATDWNAKHRQLLLYSKQLPVLPPEQRVPEYEISGCEANVWLHLPRNLSPIINSIMPLLPEDDQAKAYSDSKVVRGILAVLLGKLTQLRNTQTAEFDFSQYLSDLGLSTYFSVGRKDGIAQIIKRIEIQRLVAAG